MGKEKETVKEVDATTPIDPIESLKSQLRDYKDQALYFNNMALKAEGALDVLIQIKENQEGESK